MVGLKIVTVNVCNMETILICIQVNVNLSICPQLVFENVAN